MSDWAVGDLALCVNAQPISLADGGVCEAEGLVEGCTYRVLGAFVCPLDWVECLRLEEDDDDGWGRLALRFRKIRPDEHEPCEAEFVTLIKRIKRKEVA